MFLKKIGIQQNEDDEIIPVQVEPEVAIDNSSAATESYVIGKGKHGKVFRPPLECLEPTNLTSRYASPEYVMKVTSMDSAQREIKIANVIRSQQPNFKVDLGTCFELARADICLSPSDPRSKSESVLKSNVGIYSQFAGKSLAALLVSSSLDDLISDPNILLFIFYVVAKELEILHRLHVVHNDIAARNILVDLTDSISIKIADFGEATSVLSATATATATAAAAEMTATDKLLQQSKQDYTNDIEKLYQSIAIDMINFMKQVTQFSLSQKNLKKAIELERVDTYLKIRLKLYDMLKPVQMGSFLMEEIMNLKGVFGF